MHRRPTRPTTILVVALLLVAGLFGCTSSSGEDDSGLDGQAVEVGAYRIVIPTEEEVENTSSGEDSIAVEFEMDYGTVNIELFDSSLVYDERTYRGEVSRSTDTVAGVEAERVDQDTRGLYPFPGEEPLIGYSVEFGFIQTPDQSGDDHHVLSLTLFGLDEPTDAEVDAFRTDMESVIDSVEID